MIKGQGFLLISLLILFSSRLSPHTCFNFLNKTGSAGEIRSLAQENQAPQVHITRPASRSSYHRDARVPYSIRVSDAEDGESDYQEINPKEVLLKVKYLPDAGKINAYLKQKDNRDSLDLQQMIRSNCFNCHAVKSRLIGPSFLEIFNHYPHTQSKMDSLVRRISSGSSGIWGREVMPSHPELTKKEIQNMMNWIMSRKNVNDPGLNYYIGLEGALPVKELIPQKGNGVLVLTASYTDHGSKDLPNHNRKGRDIVVISVK